MKPATLIMCLIWLLSGCAQKTEATQKLDEKIVRVGISASDWPRAVSASTDFVVNATVVNAGEATIPALGKAKGDMLKVGLSYHWRQMDDKVAVWDGIFNPLKADLKKGDSQRLDIAVKAPATPGKYILEMDLVQNGAFWFAGVGSQSARMTIEVN